MFEDRVCLLDMDLFNEIVVVLFSIVFIFLMELGLVYGFDKICEGGDGFVFLFSVDNFI